MAVQNCDKFIVVDVVEPAPKMHLPKEAKMGQQLTDSDVRCEIADFPQQRNNF
jgi:hypothetical protein